MTLETPKEKTVRLMYFWLQKYGLKGCLRRIVKYRRRTELKLLALKSPPRK